MPMMVNKIIFGIIPSQVPFFVRPIGSAICSTVMSKLIDPDINTKLAYVASELEKKQGEWKWFAGGDKDGNPVRNVPLLILGCALLLT
jgi:glutathione S-transferase